MFPIASCTHANWVRNFLHSHLWANNLKVMWMATWMSLIIAKTVAKTGEDVASESMLGSLIPGQAASSWCSFMVHCMMHWVAAFKTRTQAAAILPNDSARTRFNFKRSVPNFKRLGCAFKTRTQAAAILPNYSARFNFKKSVPNFKRLGYAFKTRTQSAEISANCSAIRYEKRTHVPAAFVNWS